MVTKVLVTIILVKNFANVNFAICNSLAEFFAFEGRPNNFMFTFLRSFLTSHIDSVIYRYLTVLCDSNSLLILILSDGQGNYTEVPSGKLVIYFLRLDH